MAQLNNKFVPAFTLLCSQKMEEFVNRIVKSSSSNLFSEDYFFQLVFGLKNETRIEGNKEDLANKPDNIKENIIKGRVEKTLKNYSFLN